MNIKNCGYGSVTAKSLSELTIIKMLDNSGMFKVIFSGVMNYDFFLIYQRISAR